LASQTSSKQIGASLGKPNFFHHNTSGLRLAGQTSFITTHRGFAWQAKILLNKSGLRLAGQTYSPQYIKALFGRPNIPHKNHRRINISLDILGRENDKKRKTD